MPEKFFAGLDLTGFENHGRQKPVSRVTLMVDDENAITAGDDTGSELSASCPHATQAMANAILAQVKGYQYQMYEASDANIDPAAELGDGLDAGGIYAAISRMDDDGSGYMGLSSPGEEELEDEYPSAGPMTQEFSRKIAQTNSRITKTAEQILLEVQGVDGRVTSLSTKVDSITLSVVNGSTSSIIKLMAGSVEMASQTIQMDGLVTFAGLSGGTTTIDGSCIKTGTIEAERLNLTGAIKWRDLSSGLQGDINDVKDKANDVGGVVSGWTYSGSTYIDGTKIKTGTVQASYLLGGYVGLLNYDETEVGQLVIGPSSSSQYRVELNAADGALQLSAGGGDVYVSAYGYVTLDARDGITVRNDLYPSSNARYDLGISSFVWDNVYAYSGTINTSDRRKKRAIRYDMERYEALFDALRPVSYQMADGTSGRTHTGFVAQDVEDALAASGMTSLDFAGFIRSPILDDQGQETGDYNYALRYAEFVALNTWQLQRLKARVAELERRLAQ